MVVNFGEDKGMLKRTPINYQDWETPPEAIYPLMKYIPRDKTIWECACGSLRMARVFAEMGHTVIATDKASGMDFRTCSMPDGVDVIVTNPPHKFASDFLRRCYQLKKPFALLLPLRMLEHAHERFRLFEKWGLQLLFLDERIHYLGVNGRQEAKTTFDSVWLCWRLLPKQIVFERLRNVKTARKRRFLGRIIRIGIG